MVYNMVHIIASNISLFKSRFLFQTEAQYLLLSYIILSLYITNNLLLYFTLHPSPSLPVLSMKILTMKNDKWLYFQAMDDSSVHYSEGQMLCLYESYVVVCDCYVYGFGKGSTFSTIPLSVYKHNRIYSFDIEK